MTALTPPAPRSLATLKHAWRSVVKHKSVKYAGRFAEPPQLELVRLDRCYNREAADAYEFHLKKSIIDSAGPSNECALVYLCTYYHVVDALARFAGI